MSRLDEFDHPFTRLGQMTERLAIDPLVGLQCEAAALASAIQRCRGCGSDAACREWLRRADAAIDAPPAFCPNAGLLGTLRGREVPADIGCWI
ncbi:MAG: hypothetical protein IT537_18145 [Hyphomicrobiales bacterium]|nr:hypothetical protein [Hyphomicrobiales bacterium]